MNIPSFAKKYQPVDSKVNGYLILDGKEYEIENFQIIFGQPVDFKGQPQHETKGGQFLISLSQAPSDTIYQWGKKDDSKKNGTIKFVSETEGPVMTIDFTEAYCISLTHKINAFSGTETSLVVAPKTITMNGMYHDNKWRNQ